MPLSWIDSDDTMKKTKCHFPPGPDYDGLHEKVKNLACYDDNWPVFTVRIVGQACKKDSYFYIQLLCFEFFK